MLYDGQVPQFPGVGNASGSYSNTNVSVRKAIDWSLNTTALRASLGTDMNVVTDNLAKMQFSRLHPYDVNNIIAIGGFTYGTTTTEMAGAFSSFTNQGNFVRPTNVESIKNSFTGEILYQNPRKNVKVYSQEASYAMLDLMKTSATGATTYDQQAVADNYPKHLQAGKSGTTDNFKDSYWVGVTAHYTTAVWVGRDSGVSLNKNEQPLAKRINKDISTILLAGKEVKDFVKPNSVAKNGDSITFLSKEDISDSSSNLTTTEFNKEEEERRHDSSNQNQNRLKSEEYRIIYGLTLEEEESLENSALSKLSQINVSEFTNKDQYKDYLNQLSDARSAIEKVKRSEKKAELELQLNDLQSKVADIYANMIYQDNLNKYYSDQAKISEAKDKSSKERQKLIDEQLRKLSLQKSEVEKDPTQDNINKLDDIIYELNRLGYNHGYYNVVVKDGKFISMTVQQ